MTVDDRSPLDILIRFLSVDIWNVRVSMIDIPFAFLSRILDLNFQPAARLEVAHVSKAKAVGFIPGAVLS